MHANRRRRRRAGDSEEPQLWWVGQGVSRPAMMPPLGDTLTGRGGRAGTGWIAGGPSLEGFDAVVDHAAAEGAGADGLGAGLGGAGRRRPGGCLPAGGCF